MKKQTLALACLMAGLVAACGGGSSPSTQSPAFAATVTASTSASTSTTTATGTRWMNVKYGGSGYVPGLVFHPTSPNVLYARTDMGGSYRWDAATSAWTPITDGFGIRKNFSTVRKASRWTPTTTSACTWSRECMTGPVPMAACIFQRIAAITGPTSISPSASDPTTLAAPSANA